VEEYALLDNMFVIDHFLDVQEMIAGFYVRTSTKTTIVVVTKLFSEQ
jgi:hypothetical protein